MKNITQNFIKIVLLITIHLSLFTQNAQAQAPQKMSYQAVIRNASNSLVVSTPVAIKVSILQGSATGTATYVERHTPTTNANGLATFEIGTGSVISGVFANIDWKNSQFHIKTETDPAGGTNYTIVGTSQLTSVPYALNAKTSEDNKWISNSSGINNISGYVGIGNTNPGFALDVSNRMRIRSGGGVNSAGLWLNNNLNTNVNTFIGIDLSNNFGIYSQTTSNYVFTAKMDNGNIGIGTTNPTEKLEVAGKTKTVDLQVTTGAGAGKVLTSDATGNATWQTPTTASPSVWSTTGLNNIVNTNSGNVGISTSNPTTKLEVNGFTKLGTDAPAIKVKKLTGTTGSTQGAFINILHGLTFSKILSIDVLVESNGYLISEAYDVNGYDFSFFANATDIVVVNSGTNSGNILSKPIRVLITYEE